MQTKALRRWPSLGRGVTLIELMVGMAVGLGTLLAVFQIYSSWDGRQRTSTAKNDAQISGTLAAYMIERDLRQAGLGYGPASAQSDMKVGCVVNAYFSAGTPTNFTFPLQSIQIINGAAGVSDQILALYGNSSYRSIRELVVGSDSSTKYLLNRGGVMPGDFVILSDANNPNSCQLLEVTHTSPAIVGSPRAFQHNVGVYQSAYQPTGQMNNAVMNEAGGTGVLEFDELFNLGPAPQANLWRVGGATPVRPLLVRQNILPTNGAASPLVEVAEGIVNIQAQYGYDVDNDGRITANEWFDPNPAVAPAVGLPVPTDWSRLLAMRYGLLARSRHYEALPFRASPPTWAGGAFTMTDLSGGADSNPLGADNWRAYRHMVYEAVIPLRNVLWGRAL